MEKYINCNLCGFNKTDIIQKAEPPYNVVKCKRCGLVYVNPQPDREKLEFHYNQNYYKEWIEKQLPKRLRMWKKRIKELKNYRNKGKLLDIGCGLGTFLYLMKKEGFEVVGTEISKWASEFIKKKYNIEIFNGTLEEAKFPSESFDIITLWHSLEHIPNPKETLNEINRILKKDGLLLIACPNFHNFIVRILYLLVKRKKLKIFSCNAKELHLFHFSIKTLTLMLISTGFKVLKVDLDITQIEFREKIVDFLTFIFYLITGKNFGEAFKIYAVKK